MSSLVHQLQFNLAASTEHKALQLNLIRREVSCALEAIVLSCLAKASHEKHKFPQLRSASEVTAAHREACLSDHARDSLPTLHLSLVFPWHEGIDEEAADRVLVMSSFFQTAGGQLALQLRYLSYA